MAVLFDVVQVGPVKDGKCSVTFPDRKNGTYRTVVATQEKADEFLSERKNIERKANIGALSSMGVTTVLGALAGAVAKVGKYSTRGSNAVLGVGIGMLVGCLPALYFSVKKENNSSKLTEKFIAENQQD